MKKNFIKLTKNGKVIKIIFFKKGTEIDNTEKRKIMILLRAYIWQPAGHYKQNVQCLRKWAGVSALINYAEKIKK